MATLYEHEVLIDAIRSAISDLGLDENDHDVVLKTLCGVAMDDTVFKEKFIYAMRPESYQTNTRKTDLTEIGSLQTDVVPKLCMPVYSFKRSTKPVIQLKSKLSSSNIAYLNRHYADEFDIKYLQLGDHDHAVAAMSRKIEYDVLLKSVWESYANPLLLPTNYDFSVIDVGGDWATVFTRKQYGMHVCNPLLDARDRSRDIRKRMRDTTGFSSTAYVCRETLQSCSKTAPVAISLHSSYDIDPKDIVTSMARRGIILYTGTMFLPENFSNVSKYCDKDYEYNVQIDKPNVVLDKVQSFMEGTISSARTKGKTLAIYTFPRGESRAYCHDYDNLLKYTQSQTYKIKVNSSERDSVTVDYKIVRRVGSLVYFEFRQNFEKLPANISIAKTIQKEPFNGYRATLDASFFRNTTLYGVTPVEIMIPRGLFDVVASYCLTRITAEDFTIENVLAYTRSVMSSIQINDSVLVLNDTDDTFELMVACSLAAFQWSHERFRLLESRVPYRNYIEKFLETSDSLESLVDKVINKEKLMNEAKATAIKVGSSIVDSMLLEHASLKAKLDTIIDLIKKIKSPCLLDLVDMEFLVEPIELLQIIEPLSDSSSESLIVLNSGGNYVLPTYPDYNQTVLPTAGKSTNRKTRYIEAEDLINDIVKRRFEKSPDYSSLQSTDIPVPIEEIAQVVDANANEDDMDIEMMKEKLSEEALNNHENHIKSIYDFVLLAQAGDDQHIEGAKKIVDKVVSEEQLVTSLLKMRADLRGDPIVLGCTAGEVVSIKNSEKTLYKGQEEFDIMLHQYDGMAFCTKLHAFGEAEPSFRRLTLKKNVFYPSNESSHQNFDAIYIVDVQILIAHLYSSLLSRIKTIKVCQGNLTTTILTDGVAGCGKTHTQVHAFANDIKTGNNPAIFSATKAAALQALARLLNMGVPASNNNVCTVDSFLMNKEKWSLFTHVYVDEALQLHSGKLIAILEITNPLIMTGFGDKKQITYINFTRHLEPSVDTTFNWSSVIKIDITRRIKRGKRIKWLQDAALYGENFDSAIPYGEDRVSKFAVFTGLEKKVSIEWLYKTLQISINEPLLVLVYRKEVAADLRMKFKVTREIPPEGSEHRLAVATIGESQGEDVMHSVLLRLSSKDEALYSKSDQTIVGMTRSNTSWGYIAVPSNFPTMIEKVIARSMETIQIITLQE